MTGNRKDLIEYRLSQARDSIREADVCGAVCRRRRSFVAESELSKPTPEFTPHH